MPEHVPAMAGSTVKCDDHGRQSIRFDPVRNVDRRAAPLIIGIFDVGDGIMARLRQKMLGYVRAVPQRRL